jgi:hypothetical protein
MTSYADAEIHVGDIGTLFELTLEDGDGVAVDISSATVKELHFRRGDGSALKVTAAFETNGSDGVLQYVTVLGDLNSAGDWEVQPYLEMVDWRGHAGTVRFVVWSNLPPAA